MCSDKFAVTKDTIEHKKWGVWYVDVETFKIDNLCDSICDEISQKICYYLEHFPKIKRREKARAENVIIEKHKQKLQENFRSKKKKKKR